MPDADDTINRSPGGWLTFLEPKLDDQARRVRGYRDYYDGQHRLSHATAKFKEAFARFFPPLADNWMKIIVDSAVERLYINGFRFEADQPEDDKARAFWNRNKLDSKQRIIFTEAVKCGKAFLLVDPTPEDGPRITGENATEVYVHCDPATGERLAAIKKWIGDDNFWHATVYLPQKAFKFKSRNKAGEGNWRSYRKPQWGTIGETVEHGYDVVPMIPLENNPDMMIGGISDLDVVMPIQDRVNKLCLDLDVSSEFFAMPARWASGWEPPKDPNTGQPLPAVQAEAANTRMFAFANPEAKAGQMPAGDPKSYIEPIEMYVRHMAALSRTPPHYLLGEIVNTSGDALTVAETGLVARVEGKQTDFADPWEEAVCLALERNPEEAEVLWRDPQSRTFGQLVDGVAKLRESLNLPLEMAWEMVGMSPSQVKRAAKLIGLPNREPSQNPERTPKPGEPGGPAVDPAQNGNDPARDVPGGTRPAGDPQAA